MLAFSVLVGRLGRDPELRTTQAGQELAQLSVATSRRVKRDTQWEEHTEWHNVTLWGQPASFAAEQVHKGDLVLVVGEPRSRSWEDAQGAKRVTHEIVVGGPQHVFRRLMASGEGAAVPHAERPAPAERPVPARSKAELAEELPF
jgi:single-strand DNA-binding protein